MIGANGWAVPIKIVKILPAPKLPRKIRLLLPRSCRIFKICSIIILSIPKNHPRHTLNNIGWKHASMISVEAVSGHWAKAKRRDNREI
jgi:hypothetical protein